MSAIISCDPYQQPSAAGRRDVRQQKARTQVPEEAGKGKMPEGTGATAQVPRYMWHVCGLVTTRTPVSHSYSEVVTSPSIASWLVTGRSCTSTRVSVAGRVVGVPPVVSWFLLLAKATVRRSAPQNPDGLDAAVWAACGPKKRSVSAPLLRQRTSHDYRLAHYH